MSTVRLILLLIEFGADEYALLQGRVVEFRMTQRMVTLGRSTPSCPVTFDLSLEGPAYKISRRQVSNQYWLLVLLGFFPIDSAITT